ncbi:hypothetical protein E2C01_102007 [Portunus trituberculatus]|uniref:Uncharacterized protein n=1 Tax=Portunus trituberculatus TaxID=210409 RepID=A0A5B7K705_PORTR|nr:hypothetical protein [Portunus trituberculatus]
MPHKLHLISPATPLHSHRTRVLEREKGSSNRRGCGRYIEVKRLEIFPPREMTALVIGVM